MECNYGKHGNAFINPLSRTRPMAVDFNGLSLLANSESSKAEKFSEFRDKVLGGQKSLGCSRISSAAFVHSIPSLNPVK